jgi:3-methyladenine DNA glycosylase/8-oxoguanine DNA glycosylase
MRRFPDWIEAERALRESDPKLGLLIERHGPCRLKSDGAESPFAALAKSIAYQQLNGTAAATIFSRVVALYRPKPFPDPEDVLGTSDTDLRAAGLSRAKTAALKDLAAKVLDGTVPPLATLERLADAEIVERLTAVRGVGPWTAEMLLIFRLGRPDVLPASDHGVRQGFARAFRTRGLPTPAQVMRRGERWRPYRSVASWFLWRAADTPGGRA